MNSDSKVNIVCREFKRGWRYVSKSLTRRTRSNMKRAYNRLARRTGNLVRLTSWEVI